MIDPTNHLAIQNVLHGYCDCVDRADLEGLSQLFDENAEFDYGFGRIFHGRDQIVTLLTSRLHIYAATSHHLSNIRIERLSENEATSECYIHAWHQFPDGRTADVFGRYFDDLVEGPDGWVISRRRVRAAGSTGFDAPEGLPSPFELIERRGRQ